MEIDIGIFVLFIFLLVFISGIGCEAVNICCRHQYCIGETEVYEETNENNNLEVVVVDRPDAMIYINEYISQLNIEQRMEIFNTLRNDLNEITLYQYYHIIGRYLQIYFEDEMLEKLSYKSDENEFCSICQSDIDNEKMCSRFPCGHFFHEECIFDWFKHSGKCPLCMKVIYER